MFFDILFWFIILGIALKIYIKLRLRRNGSYICLVGKTAIITGANTGIGYITALDFAKRGARVILACRNKDKAEDAQKSIIKASQNENVVYKLIEMSSFESVRAFAKDINETEERVDILINNAGAGRLGNRLTKNGVQITLQINHISGFLLTHLLIDKIKMSVPSRIVNISSIAAKISKLDVEKFNEFPASIHYLWSDWMAYANSKLCNILFTIVLANKLNGTGVTVNTLHPGIIKTEIFRRVPGIFKIGVNLLSNLYFQTAEEGAQTTIYVATSEKLDGVTGKFFDNCKQIDLYHTARDPILAEKVWTKSEQLAKLNLNDKIQ